MTISSISSRRSPSPTETGRQGAAADTGRPSTLPTEGLQDLSIKPRGASAASSSSSIAPRQGVPVAAVPVAATHSPVTPGDAPPQLQPPSQQQPPQDPKAGIRKMLADYETHLFEFRANRSRASAENLRNAAEKLLLSHSELPRPTAVRLLNDNKVKEIYGEAFHALCLLTVSTMVQSTPLTEDLDRREKIYNKLADKSSGNFEKAIQTSIKKLRAFLALQEGEVGRAISQEALSACTANIRLSKPEKRTEQARSDAGLVAMHQFMLLDRRVQLAQWTLRSVSGNFPVALKEAVLDEKGEVRTLAHLSSDIAPAIRSTAFGDAERAATRPASRSAQGAPGLGIAPAPIQMGCPLDRDNQAVLEGAIDRLQEFAVAVEELEAKLIEHSASTHVHVVGASDALTKVAKDAWFMASTLSKRLEFDQQAPEPAPPPVTAPLEATASNRANSRKDKGNAKARQRKHEPSAASTAAARPAVVPASEEAQAPAPKKQLVRSKLGTPMLQSAEEATAAAAAAEAMKQRLQDLDALLAIDIPAKQRALAHAREGVSPENGTYAVKEIVKEIGQITDAMKDCQTQLADPKERTKLVAPGQMPQVHAKTVELKNKLHQLEGLANAATKNIEVSELDHVKTYRLPKQAHIERLFREGQLAAIGKPQALQGEPGTLFEVKLQPSALRNGATPAPIWLHIHTHAPVQAHQLAKLDDSLFAASHVKTNEERGRGRQWQNARAAEGYEHVQIHRGKVSPELCRELLGRG